MARARLTSLLRQALPGPSQAQVLTAALGPAPAAQASWDLLLSTGDGHLGHLSAGERELLSLLLRGVEAHGLDVPAGLRSVLRAARLREEARGHAVEAAVGRALGDLEDRGADPVVLGGVALATDVYDGWGERHCGLLEVLVAPGAGRTAPVEVDGLRVAARSVVLPHAHRHPLPHASVLDRTVRTTIAGQRVRVLPPHLAMLERLAVAGLRRDPSAWWAADAHRLAERGAVSWPEVSREAARAGVTMAVWLRAGWLARELASPVPASTLASLRRAAAREVVPVTARALGRRLRRRARR